LTGAEFNILQALIQAGGAILSRSDLSQYLQEPSENGNSERVVDVHIAALRRKLGKARNFVKTVHGQGYRAAI